MIVELFGGAFTVKILRHEDDRGSFSNILCRRELDKEGITVPVIDQVNLSFSKYKGTLRGMHYQIDPDPQIKMIRCQKGSIFDAIIDMRPDSSTYLKHKTITLSKEDLLVIPTGFAQGFLTLEPETEVLYLNNGFYSSESEKGVRWNDPKVKIDWPFTPSVISEKDKSWSDL